MEMENGIGEERGQRRSDGRLELKMTRSILEHNVHIYVMINRKYQKC